MDEYHCKKAIKERHRVEIIEMVVGMKIATYNIWDDEAGMPYRFRQIVEEMIKTDADIICLQEVRDEIRHRELVENCGYRYAHYQAQTGLSILSRMPLCGIEDFESGTMVRVQMDARMCRIVNVHLPWDSAVARERIMVETVRRLEEIKDEFIFLLGDFNSAADSSVHRFLTNQQSLSGCDAYFYDLAESYAELTGKNIPATLNFRENPRWGVVQPVNTIETNQRFDWIMLRNPYPLDFPILKQCSLFGTAVSEKTGLAASDHYGVSVQIVIG